MAVDLCSEIGSPRTSFSFDLNVSDQFLPVKDQSNPWILNPAIDFDFLVAPHFSSADELFANGRILPLEIKKASPPPPMREPYRSDCDDERDFEPRKSKSQIRVENSEKKRLIEFLSTSFDAEDSGSDKASAAAAAEKLAKPFWQFGRSASLNSGDDNGRKKGLLRSLQSLTRSNSAGSVPKAAIQKRNSAKESSVVLSNTSQNSEVHKPAHVHQFSCSSRTWKRPALKKSTSRSYAVAGNPIRISPVLNIAIPTACIARGTVSLFGMGSLFSGKRSTIKKK